MIRRAAACSIALLIASAGCSLLFDVDAAQCATNDDCAARGMAGRVCSAGECLLPKTTAATDAEVDAAVGCIPETCIASAKSEPKACSPTTGQCESLLTPECSTLLGTDLEGVPTWRDPNSVLLVAFAPRAATDSAYVQNYALAIDEFNHNIRGLPPVARDERRLLTMLVCGTESADPKVIAEVGRHAFGKLGARAAVWSRDNGELQTVMDEAAGARSALIVNSGGSTRFFSANPSDGLWHLLGDLRELSAVYGAVLARMETKLRETRDADGGKANLRVALFHSERSLDEELHRELLHDPNVRINGLPLTSGGEAGTVRVFRVPENAVPAPPPKAWEDAAAKILEFRPDIVVSTAGDEVVHVFGLVEKHWDDDGGAPPRPRYLFSPFNVTPPHSGWIASPAGPNSEQLRWRIVGVNAARDTYIDIKRLYESAYGLKYGQHAAPEGTSYENAYDAVYFAGYALAGATRAGEPLADVMKRLITGQSRIDVGPLHLAEGTVAVASGESIALHGTLGPPNFDLRTHARRQKLSVYCFERYTPSSDEDPPIKVKHDVLIYDPGSDGGATGGDGLIGTFACQSHQTL